LINDLDHHVTNLWRSLQHDSEKVWQLASCPISEVELKARHAWLKTWKPYDFSDVNAYDTQAAGFWLWVMSVSIGMGSSHLNRDGFPHGVKGRTFTKELFDQVVDRIKGIEILCGDWKRCLTSATINLRKSKTVGVFLDPPYGVGTASYANDGGVVAREVWDWAVANGNNPQLRIVVAGYEDGRILPKGWTAIERIEQGSYGKKDNGSRQMERLWLSPYCLRPDQGGTHE
jgi:hypothetical protein